MEDKNYINQDCWSGLVIEPPNLTLSTLYMVDNRGYTFEINIDKKFNWFQKKMIKWCFGFEVKENN
jgi:hypothetical protein